MEKIISKLVDPSWWFTGIFFILLGIFIAWAIKKIPSILRTTVRGIDTRILRRIKNTRRNKWEIHYQIASDQSYFLVFLLVSLLYLVLLLASPLAIIFKNNLALALFLSSPIYIAEIIWLKKNTYVKRLIKYASKIT